MCSIRLSLAGAGTLSQRVPVIEGPFLNGNGNTELVAADADSPRQPVTTTLLVARVADFPAMLLQLQQQALIVVLAGHSAVGAGLAFYPIADIRDRKIPAQMRQHQLFRAARLLGLWPAGQAEFGLLAVA